MSQQLHSQTRYRYLTQVSPTADAKILGAALFVTVPSRNNSIVRPSPEEWVNSGIYTLRTLSRNEKEQSTASHDTTDESLGHTQLSQGFIMVPSREHRMLQWMNWSINSDVSSC